MLWEAQNILGRMREVQPEWAAVRYAHVMLTDVLKEIEQQIRDKR